MTEAQVSIALISFMIGTVTGFFLATRSFVQGYLEQKARIAWTIKQGNELLEEAKRKLKELK